MKIPVLTYHSMNIESNAYAENDHLALASDLQTIRQLGYEIIPLSQVVNWHQGALINEPSSKVIALTLDDGSWFDYYDLNHPTCGMQRSMFNILKDFQEQTHRSLPVHATSFVITSPEARDSLDKSCMIGRGWWSDAWWAEAALSGIMDIECHSWDHVHPELETVAQQDQIKGDFGQIRSEPDCQIQFVHASNYLHKTLAGTRPRLFAYPWGKASDYVLNDYLPNQRDKHHFQAAFSIEPRAVSKSDNIWWLPRFVCGRDWKTPLQLNNLLSDL
jgi:peptidoglycan/xylan/chitin deacetylase (PgdA/CDA1 family)